MSDSQRMIRGLVLVAQEFYRLNHSELSRCTQARSHHAGDVLSKLPKAGQALSGQMAAMAPPPPEPIMPTSTPPVDASAFATAWAPLRPPPPPEVMPHPTGAAQPTVFPRIEVEPPVLAPRVSVSQEPLTSKPIPAEPVPAAREPPREEPPTERLAASASTAPATGATIAEKREPLPEAPISESPIRKKREFRERAVPASPLARVWGFGSLAASMALGAAGEAVGKVIGGGSSAATVPPPAAPVMPTSTAPEGGRPISSSSSSSSAPSSSNAAPPPVFNMSAAQAERLAEGLCRMRGAALKVGQMLSLTDESLIPPAMAAVLERVRTQADIMPKRQLEQVMRAELGDDWRAKLGGDKFEEMPVAAASIGQVHRSVLPDGRKVAIKVQYPGVAESIQSDINNLKRLLTITNFLPKGLYLDSIVAVAKEELTAECDYRLEAEKQERFRMLASGDPDFEVPAVVKELSTRRVLVTTWLEGMPIDQVVDQGYPLEVRNNVARKLLKLTLRELFEWRFMQTDPNWGNFFYDPKRDKIGLLDFGAARSFPKPFCDDYLRLVWAAANNDADTIRDVSVKLGFLTGFETKVMMDAHVESGLVVGEPFLKREPFDFKASGITKRVAKHGAVFAEHRLTPPPNEVYPLHRKLAGAFFICIRMGAVIPCRDMLESTWNNYTFGPTAADGSGDGAEAHHGLGSHHSSHNKQHQSPQLK